MAGVEAALDRLAAKPRPAPRKRPAASSAANNNMVNATSHSGQPRPRPARLTLIAFGGGGGMHACALARELSIKKVVIPKTSSVFRRGHALTDLRRDYLQTQIGPVRARAAPSSTATCGNLEEEASRPIVTRQTCRARLRYGRCRYRTRSTRSRSSCPTARSRRADQRHPPAVDEDYEREYPSPRGARGAGGSSPGGHRRGGQAPAQALPRAGNGADASRAVKERRDVDWVQDGVQETTVYNGDELTPACTTGPAIIEESGPRFYPARSAMSRG